jgi:hypothetical protein
MIGRVFSDISVCHLFRTFLKSTGHVGAARSSSGFCSGSARSTAQSSSGSLRRDQSLKGRGVQPLKILLLEPPPRLASSSLAPSTHPALGFHRRRPSHRRRPCRRHRPSRRRRLSRCRRLHSPLPPPATSTHPSRPCLASVHLLSPPLLRRVRARRTMSSHSGTPPLLSPLDFSLCFIFFAKSRVLGFAYLPMESTHACFSPWSLLAPLHLVDVVSQFVVFLGSLCSPEYHPEQLRPLLRPAWSRTQSSSGLYSGLRSIA